MASPGDRRAGGGRGAEFLITVDNGISSIAGWRRPRRPACRYWLPITICRARELPDADAIVNPNQRWLRLPLKSLAGVGVAFYLMAALNTHLRQSGWYERQGLRAPTWRITSIW